MPHRHCGIDRHRYPNTKAVQRLHHAKNADAVAVVAQRVMPQVRIGRHQSSRRLERLALHVQRKPFERGHDPKRDPGAAGPRYFLPLRKDRPRVTVVIHPVAAMRVFKVVGWHAHGASPTGSDARAKASK